MYLLLLFVLQNKMFIRFFDGLWKNLESTQGMKLSLPFLTFILCVLPLFFHLEFTKIYQQKIFKFLLCVIEYQMWGKFKA